MREVRKLSVLLLLTAALAVCLVSLNNAPTADSMPPAPTAAAQPYRMLYTCSQADFADMTVALPSGESYTVISDLVFDSEGNLLGVNNGLGQPIVVSGNEGFALNTELWQMVMLTAENLPVTASYTGLDMSACGLDIPEARITINYHTGESIRLNVGRITADGSSCYIQMEGDDSIHIVPVDFRHTMTKPLSDHHRLPGAAAENPLTALQIAVVRPGKDAFIAAYRGTDAGILPWQIEQPFVHGGSTERIQDFVEAVAAICAEEYVATVSSTTELAAYGLAQPTRLLVAFGNGNIRDIHIGDDAGDGRVYARMDSTADVYLINSSLLPRIDDDGLDLLLDRFVSLYSTRQVRNVSVVFNETLCALDIVSSDEGITYSINGRTVSGDVFAPIFTATVGMQFDKSAVQSSTGAPLCVVEFTLTDGTKTAVTYTEYDRYYVHASKSGGGEFLLRRERIENMLNIIGEALQ